MILDIIVNKTDDGFNANVPSIQECESWAHDEETVLDNILERVSYFLQLEKSIMELDRARRSKTETVYKLIIKKTSL